jgi:uncharacterized protein YceK
MHYPARVATLGLAAAVMAGAAPLARGATTLAGIYRFPPANANGAAAKGFLPIAGLTPDPSGSGGLFGTTSRGGSYKINGYGGGLAFELLPPAAGKTAWTQTVLHAFTGGADGIFPGTGNLLVKGGTVYGTTAGNALFGGCGNGQKLSCDTVFALAPPAAGKTAWSYAKLYSFPGGKDGYNPQGGLIAGPAGSLYGTTAAGGNTACQSSYTNLDGTSGCGTVFQLLPPAKSGGAWTRTTLHTFTGGTDGGIPLAALLADPSGSGVLYGVASTGGVSNCSFGTANCGVVFSLAPPAAGKTAWTEKVLYSFTGGKDGLAPLGALTMSGGVLYGTTLSGGYSCDIYGCGTVFSLTPPAKGGKSWAFKALYAFKGGKDGGVPQAGLYRAGSGALYGTTFQFGSSNTNLDCGRFVGCGTVFKVSPPAAGKTAWTESVLYAFNGGANGGQSSAPLAFSAGVLFGTVALGGEAACPAGIAPVCGGVVFKVSP